MQSFQFKPNLFDPFRIIFIGAALIAPIIILTILVPKVILLRNFPEISVVMNELLLILSLGILIPVVLVALSMMSLFNKKIKIEGELLYFSDKSLFKSPDVKVVDLKTIKMIGEETKIGLAVKAVIVYYWWSLSLKDNTTTKILLTGWDKSTLKKVLLQIKEIHPEILVDTSIYRDSSEKLSGIHELIKS